MAEKFQRLEALYEAAKLTVLRAAWLSGEGKPNNLEASVCKAKAGAAVREITQGCIEILGPLGVSREHLLEKWFRDVRITDIYEGTGEIQRMIIARDLLGYGRAELELASAPLACAPCRRSSSTTPGDESVLRLGEAPAPALGPGALRLRVAATAVNRADLLQRQGLYPPPPGASEILGLECAGEVVEVADGVAAGRSATARWRCSRAAATPRRSSSTPARRCTCPTGSRSRRPPPFPRSSSRSS